MPQGREGECSWLSSFSMYPCTHMWGWFIWQAIVRADYFWPHRYKVYSHWHCSLFIFAHQPVLALALLSIFSQTVHDLKLLHGMKWIWEISHGLEICRLLHEMMSLLKFKKKKRDYWGQGLWAVVCLMRQVKLVNEWQLEVFICGRNATQWHTCRSSLECLGGCGSDTNVSVSILDYQQLFSTINLMTTNFFQYGSFLRNAEEI